MTEDQSLQELQADIQKLLEADTDDFAALGKLIGLDARKDLVGADLQDTDLRGAILSGANLRNTRFGDNEGISEAMKRNFISNIIPK